MPLDPPSSNSHSGFGREIETEFLRVTEKAKQNDSRKINSASRIYVERLNRISGVENAYYFSSKGKDLFNSRLVVKPQKWVFSMESNLN